MAPIDDALNKLIVPVAFLSGIFMETMVFEFEKTLMVLEVQANYGFFIMILLVYVSPFLVTGGLIYYFKEDFLESLFVSALTLAVFFLITLSNLNTFFIILVTLILLFIII